MFGKHTEESDSSHIMQKLVHILPLSNVNLNKSLKISVPNIDGVGRFFCQKYFSHIQSLTKSMCLLDLLYLKVHKNVHKKENSNKSMINRFGL